MAAALGAVAKRGGFNGGGAEAKRAPLLTFVGASTASGGARFDGSGRRLNPAVDPALVRGKKKRQQREQQQGMSRCCCHSFAHY